MTARRKSARRALGRAAEASGQKGTMRGFVSLCRSFSSAEFAQGFGGNVSAKLDRFRMAIKASGVRLADVSESGGFSFLEYGEIARQYSHDCRTGERRSDEAVAESVLAGGEPRPSMEAAFHSILGVYVVHLHPVYLNAILCQSDAKARLEEIFGKGGFVWVGYKKPGHALAAEISERIGKQMGCVSGARHGSAMESAQQEGRAPHSLTIFLQNHGVIVSSSSAGACAERIRVIERKALAYLKQKAGPFRAFSCRALAAWSGGYVNASEQAKTYAADRGNTGRFLFPDAAVFSAGIFAPGGMIFVRKREGIFYRMSKAQAGAINETLAAHIYLLEATKKLGRPRYLSRAEIQEILSMNSEKRRQKKAGLPG